MSIRMTSNYCTATQDTKQKKKDKNKPSVVSHQTDVSSINAQPS